MLIIKKMPPDYGGIFYYICALIKLKLYDVQSSFYRHGWHFIKK